MASGRNITKLASLALGLPSTIFGSGYILFTLSDEGILSQNGAITLFMLITLYSLGIIIWYGTKKER